MRIIAGTLGGRIFEGAKGHRTHPMSDRVRGALFNSLGDISDLVILDAFAGTGALSFEAVSRGAEHVTAIDIDRGAVEGMKRAVGQFGIEKQCKIIRANASSWSNNNEDMLFDIVIAAPPYDNLQIGLVQKLAKHVKKDGLFVLDWPGKETAPEIATLSLEKAKVYGDAQLAYYSKNN